MRAARWTRHRHRVALVVAGVAAITVAGAAPGLATGSPPGVGEYSGNTNPAGQDWHGRCGTGKRWVYVSPSPSPSYNPLAKTTDVLGADHKAPPNSNADLFDDGVTITITLDGTHALFSINEATDPSTTITVTKVVVKAGSHFTVYTPPATTPDTPLSSPHAGYSLPAVSHAYVCYTVNGPPPQVPEVAYPALLAGAAALGATVVVLRRRPRAA